MSTGVRGTAPRFGCASFFLVGCVVLGLGVSAHYIWHAYEVELFITMLALGALLFALRHQLRSGGWFRATSTAVAPRPLAMVVSGISLTTMGTVRAPEPPPTVPLSAGACAWSRVRVLVDGAIVADVRTSDVVVMEDGAGAFVEVDLSNAELRARSLRFASSGDLPNRMVLDWLAERGLAQRSANLELVVDWLPLRELVFVTGKVESVAPAEQPTAYRTSERASLRIVADGPRAVVVTVGAA